MIKDDEKYNALRDSLRSLPRVKAKKDFEARLMQRIRETTSPVEAPGPVVHVTQKIRTENAAKSWFSNLFRPAFAPALGLTVVLLITVVVYFAYFSKMNNGSPENTQQFVSSTNQGDLVIYVKKDGEDPGSNYPKEYSAVEPGTDSREESQPVPTETSSDFDAKPDPSRSRESEIKPDRVSEEQRIEMQKTVDPGRDKGVDVKGERKSDDGILKKESKDGYFKTETKGEMKKESKSPEKKSTDEKKNIYIDDSNEVKQEEKTDNAPTIEDQIKSNDNVQQQTDETPKNRISRATKKDSTQNKSDSEADEHNTMKK